ncbi:NADH-quinone oxidoreductase subunit NuoG [Marinobacter caseinilyticus]|uniref:NADH-quinone oxidoreductase subunit NuoG n=1 Tax=Marinobacter caseinilyticus TaxID=2692195 RepID=UPI0014081356|nr:NADH-quinone oxidoreductase subunit NuoG [Marinobacter caseinilyticus]
MTTIHVDGQSYQVVGADNLLHACLSLGLDVPYFCWHPAMGSVGACRQCAVKQYRDADDTQGTLVMSCMAPVTDNARIAISDEEAVTFRQSVIEWLMINHPHDCPVCEEGGHCHLQDMTVMTGHDRRRYRFHKRTHRNQDLGPFVAHEMNRCITCYRCVRFYNDYAGGQDLGAFGANDNVYFGRYKDGTLESEFAGNLTEVCPTGVFTDQTHSERYTRKWDLQFAPSICHQCAVGCNISPGERYGDIRRIENRYHGEVNRYFLCDRGRFGYGYVNREDRPRQPEWHGHSGDERLTLEVDAALDRGSDALRDAYRIIGIGSPRASLESNHALKLLVGANNFATGMTAAEQACVSYMVTLNRTCGLPTPTLREVESHDAVLVLGEDLIQSAARLGLAVRQAALGKREELAVERGIPVWNAEAVKTLGQDHYHPLYTAYPIATGLDAVATGHWSLAPSDIARLGFAIAHAIDPSAPAVTDLDATMQADATRIAVSLMQARRPLVVSGGSLGSMAILEAAGNVARALARRAHAGGLVLVRREVNSTGVDLLGGETLEWALAEVREHRADAVVVLENDLYQRLPPELVDTALHHARTLVVLDHQRTPTLARAHLSLPAASFAEGDGTLVSLEGRAQRFFQVFDPRYIRPETRIHESWRWLHALRAGLRRESGSEITLDAITLSCAQHNPALAKIVDVAEPADFRVSGVKLAREPHRYSGRTSMRANLNVSEPRTPQDVDTAFAFSMEGYNGFERPRRDVAFAWAPGWNSPQAWNKFTDEVGGHLRAGDPGVRLLSPQPGAYRYGNAVPSVYTAKDNHWQLVVLPRLFGGEETSARAAPIIERSAPVVISVPASDADRFGFRDGEPVTLVTDVGDWVLPVQVSPTLASGLVAVAMGVAPALTSGQWVRLRRSDSPGTASDAAGQPSGGASS